jgi:hypothetical protein
MIVKSQPTCAAPCWYGIVPNISTEADFTNIVDTSPSKRFDDLRRNANGPGIVQYIWRDRVVDSLMSTIIENDTVSYITFQTEPDINLQTTFQLLDTPQVYSAFLSIGEKPGAVLYLFYENQGIVVETFIPQIEMAVIDCHFELPPSATISKLYFVQPAVTQDILSNLQNVFPTRLLTPLPWTSSQNLELNLCP